MCESLRNTLEFKYLINQRWKLASPYFKTYGPHWVSIKSKHWWKIWKWRSLFLENESEAVQKHDKSVMEHWVSAWLPASWSLVTPSCCPHGMPRKPQVTEFSVLLPLGRNERQTEIREEELNSVTHPRISTNGCRTYTFLRASIIKSYKHVSIHNQHEETPFTGAQTLSPSKWIQRAS